MDPELSSVAIVSSLSELVAGTTQVADMLFGAPDEVVISDDAPLMEAWLLAKRMKKATVPGPFVTEVLNPDVVFCKANTCNELKKASKEDERFISELSFRVEIVRDMSRTVKVRSKAMREWQAVDPDNEASLLSVPGVLSLLDKSDLKAKMEYFFLKPSAETRLHEMEKIWDEYDEVQVKEELSKANHVDISMLPELATLLAQEEFDNLLLDNLKKEKNALLNCTRRLEASTILPIARKLCKAKTQNKS